MATQSGTIHRNLHAMACKVLVLFLNEFVFIKQIRMCPDGIVRAGAGKFSKVTLFALLFGAAVQWVQLPTVQLLAHVVDSISKFQIAVKQVWVKVFVAAFRSMAEYTPDVAAACRLEKGRTGTFAFWGPGFCGQVCRGKKRQKRNLSVTEGTNSKNKTQDPPR